MAEAVATMAEAVATRSMLLDGFIEDRGGGVAEVCAWTGHGVTQLAYRVRREG
jgi:hypothetical protein